MLLRCLVSKPAGLHYISSFSLQLYFGFFSVSTPGKNSISYNIIKVKYQRIIRRVLIFAHVTMEIRVLEKLIPFNYLVVFLKVLHPIKIDCLEPKSVEMWRAIWTKMETSQRATQISRITPMNASAERYKQCLLNYLQ